MSRLFVDVMLGRLARELRFLGIDTLYGPPQERTGLLEKAILTGRTILTRDTRLRAYGCRKILIVSDHWREQVRQALGDLRLDRSSLAPFTRCSRCNGPIEPAARETVQDLVPPFTFATHDLFFRCPGCSRIYWSGTHVQRIRLRIDELLGPDRPDGPGRQE